MVIDLTKKEVTQVVQTSPSITHAEFVSAANNNEEIIGFVGGVEQPVSILDEDVPVGFPKRSVVLEDDSESVRIWRDYCNHRVSVDGTKVVLTVGETNSKGNRSDVVGSEELYCWINKFGADNFKTKSEFKTLLNSSDYVIEE